MATRKSSSRTSTSAKSTGKRVAGKQRAIQRQADADNARKTAQKAARKQASKSAGKSASKKTPVQAGTRRQPENPLPKPIKQNVANLGLFVFNHTLSLMSDAKPERLGILININRELAAGLRGMGVPEDAVAAA